MKYFQLRSVRYFFKRNAIVHVKYHKVNTTFMCTRKPENPCDTGANTVLEVCLYALLEVFQNREGAQLNCPVVYKECRNSLGRTDWQCQGSGSPDWLPAEAGWGGRQQVWPWSRGHPLSALCGCGSSLTQAGVKRCHPGPTTKHLQLKAEKKHPVHTLFFKWQTFKCSVFSLIHIHVHVYILVM